MPGAAVVVVALLGGVTKACMAAVSWADQAARKAWARCRLRSVDLRPVTTTATPATTTTTSATARIGPTGMRRRAP